MIVSKFFATFVFSILMNLLILSCQYVPSQSKNSRATSDSGRPTTPIPQDTEWEFKRISEIPEEQDPLNISCAKEGTCWIWNSLAIWAPENAGGWRKIYEVMSESVDSIGNVHLLSSQLGWMVKSGRLYKTVDGGLTWNQVYVPTLDNKDGSIWTVYFNDSSTGWIAGGKYQSRLGRPDINNALSDDRSRILTGCILHTTDGGTTWRDVGVKGAIGRFTDIQFWNQVGVAFGDAGSVLTTNGGERWVDITHHFPAYETGEKPSVNSAAFLDDTAGWLVLSDSTIMSVSNNWKSWKTLYEVNIDSPSKDQPDNLAEIWFVNLTYGLVLGSGSGGGSLFKTRDGGNTWTDIPINEKLYDMVFPDMEHGILVTSKNVYTISLKGQK